MTFESLDRKRARTARIDINMVPSGCKSQYRSVVRGLPAMVQSIGIGQTYAYLRANRAKTGNDPNEFDFVLKHLSTWLASAQSVPWLEQPNASADNVFNMLLNEEPQVWWQAGSEAIEYCAWLKRYAESDFPSQAGKKIKAQSAAKEK